VLIVLVMDFNNRMAELTRLSAQKIVETEKYNNLLSRQEQLDEQIAFAASDEAVEEWARQEARLIQKGDVPVIPLQDSAAEPEEEYLAGNEEEALSNWETWIKWLLDPSP